MPFAFQIEGFKSASEIAKQIITLSSGAVAFTVTFLDKFTDHGGGPIKAVPMSLYFAWGLFGVAILFALWTLMAITGTLSALDFKTNDWPLSIPQEEVTKGRGANITMPASLMVAAFLLAIAAMIVTGIMLARTI